MAFTPENELEKAMLLAAADDSARPAFYRLLLNSDLVVLGELGETMSLETVSNGKESFHPVFTSRKRLDDFTSEAMANFTIPGGALLHSTRGAQFVINPGADVGKRLTADEIAWLLETFRPAGNELIVAQPKVLPKTLLKALCVLFTSRSLIKAAHLTYVARDGVDKEGHPLIGLEADGEVPRLVQEIFEAAAAVLPGKPIEVVYLPEGPLNPLQEHLLSVPPFYKRTLTTN
jgi:hypothetical protein